MLSFLYGLVLVQASFAFSLGPSKANLMRRLAQNIQTPLQNLITPGQSLTRGDLLLECKSGTDESDDAMKKSNINIPNLLSIARVFMIPIVVWSFLVGKTNLSLSTYIFACITDFVDGYIARKYDQMSDFGAFLDPVADKLMVVSILLLLICRIPTWWFTCPVIILVGREIFVSALREWMATAGKRAVVQVGFLGKCKTAMQMISTILLLYAVPGSSPAAEIAASATSTLHGSAFVAGMVLLLGSTLASLWSCYTYCRAALPTMTK
jgi:CDP-diacylglycerol--glycerol-3-phosphate 3-phosphatidyltransferase